ncbi:inosine 5'-monophosphate dehydrogenase [Rubripirellula tenax]|uniref:Inosine 5'-monophosphate dehydrogenase n=1 Tax=Rubripirellula tenax TaxID=2528015 RepID=A0A5C6EF58_9BACT|nr:CBS domain-containing protein [Rubripirellula tenax]TWU47155.1 inosine 5'-monophosphate dehydrogenase [Rubripirellula tenax]
MRKNEPISKIMSSNVKYVQDGEAVSKLRTIFEEDDIHHIPVTSGQKLIGIVSWNDYMRISFGEFGNQDGRELDEILDHTYKMRDVMNANVTTIPISGTVREAARMLGSKNFHALPVVDGENLVGIVTSTDLIRFLADA